VGAVRGVAVGRPASELLGSEPLAECPSRDGRRRAGLARVHVAEARREHLQPEPEARLDGHRLVGHRARAGVVLALVARDGHRGQAKAEPAVAGA
jgi:hypothetical protein